MKVRFLLVRAGEVPVHDLQGLLLHRQRTARVGVLRETGAASVGAPPDGR